jgi:hypothetical protein
MAADNLATVRRWAAAMAGSPGEALAAVGELWEPDCDYYPARKFPEAAPCHGREEVAAFAAAFRGAYAAYRIEILELTELPGDRVLARLSLSVEGHGSGVALEGEMFQCAWFRNGRFLRAEDHLTERGALAAFGLGADAPAPRACDGGGRS